MRFVGVAAIFLFSMPGCDWFWSADERAEKTIAVDEIPAEIRIPIPLWDLIEGHGPGVSQSLNPDTAEPRDGGILFTPVDVILTEKNDGVLTHPRIRIQLPRGGGEIDLSRFMGSNTGSFFVNFEFPENDSGGAPRSWFVSRSRKRRVDREVWGAGCNKYMEITDGLARLEKKAGGLKVNTTRQRHLSVLGGHFVFNVKKDSQSYLTQVTFTDANARQLFCEGG